MKLAFSTGSGALGTASLDSSLVMPGAPCGAIIWGAVRAVRSVWPAGTAGCQRGAGAPPLTWEILLAGGKILPFSQKTWQCRQTPESQPSGCFDRKFRHVAYVDVRRFDSTLEATTARRNEKYVENCDFFNLMLSPVSGTAYTSRRWFEINEIKQSSCSKSGPHFITKKQYLWNKNSAWYERYRVHTIPFGHKYRNNLPNNQMLF